MHKTCDLPGRKLEEKRFCPHPKIKPEKLTSVLVDYSVCESCPFRTEENTVLIELNTSNNTKSEPLYETTDNTDNPKQEEPNTQSERKHTLPSLSQQTSNLVNDLNKAISTGFAGVSEEEQKNRMNICQICEFFIHGQSRCSKCGCYMQLKTRLKSGKCPENKW